MPCTDRTLNINEVWRGGRGAGSQSKIITIKWLSMEMEWKDVENPSTHILEVS